jgi:predicted nucleotidyltransferase
MNESLQTSIFRFLEQQYDLVFFYVFGSVLSSQHFRDVDVAVFFRDGDYDLLRVGELVSELELITQTKTDLIVLNDLFAKNPAFAHEIVSTGSLGYFSGTPSSIDKDIWVGFKVNCIKYFEDTRYLREMSRKALLNRVETGNLGKRDYAT